MVSTMAGRASLLLTLCLAHSVFAQYQIPDVKIEVFTPKGFRASIPDAPNMGLFVFQGNVNRKIDTNELGDIAGEALGPVDGRWVVDLPEVKLTAGDVIRYHVFVSINSAGYLLDNKEHSVSTLIEYYPLSSSGVPIPTPAPAPVECRATDTKLRWGTACAGQTVFEENFNTLRESFWQVEQYIPRDHPEVPYVSYQSSAVKVENGNLRITPSLQQDQPGWSQDLMYTGVLQLNGCTESAPASCAARTEGANIIPPVVSGRVSTRSRFAFTYGTITVRAKLPQGDWLYPEILLEPLIKKYGFGPLNYKSGVIKIACARGNKHLYAENIVYANNHLYGGPILEADCKDDFLSTKMSVNHWGDEYHVYSVTWTKDEISLTVDGVKWGTAKPAPGRGLRGSLKPACQGDNEPGLTPFDDHFYITLGVAAGGLTDFLNGIFTTNGHIKPWKNLSSKATLDFWRDLKNWNATWEQPSLLVDYVKVVAL